MFDWLTWELVWVLIGFGGQALFTSRFIVQWWASEKAGRSVVPVAFWYFSVGGGLILLIYAIYKKDPVFISGQALGLIVYARNLYLIFVERSNAGREEPPATK
ncbi:MAG: lipid-A-disaccharide synthase N-terminal domain-containing protein [Alphaproteobacteria bacterium]|nr:lipid-A-disaccharide synthase N-terminal domain-containing protein [Alphaproteobacteria bacterium]